MSEDPEGGIHLLLADDTVSAGHRGRRYLTLCNKIVPLVSEHCLPECDQEHYLCPQCVSEANIWSTDTDDRQAGRCAPRSRRRPVELRPPLLGSRRPTSPVTARKGQPVNGKPASRVELAFGLAA